MKSCTLLAACGGLLLALPAARAAEPATPPAPPQAANALDPPAPTPPAVTLPPGNNPISLLAAATEKTPMVGEWTEFASLREGKVDLSDTMRISVIGDEARPDSPWTEVWIGKTGQHAIRLRKNDGPSEIFLKMGSAIFSVEDETEEAKLPACTTVGCQAMNQNKALKGRQRIKTIAGTFDCNHYVIDSEKGRTDLWSSNAVPGFNLVRMKASWGPGLELVAFGTNAYSAFPKKFKANPLPISNPETIYRMMPGLAPPGAPPGPSTNLAECDPAVATCPAPEPPPAPPIQEFDPKKK